MDFAERSKKADNIKKIIDESFHKHGEHNPDSGLTFQDIQVIRKRIEDEFKGKCPRAIAGALDVAAGLLHPNKLKAISFLKNGMSAILLTTGGISLFGGIIYIISYGLTATATIGMLWWETSTKSILFGGPVGIVIGLTSLATGIFILAKKTTPQKKTTTAQEILHKALTAWVEEKSPEEFDASLIKKLTRQEYHSLLFLLYQIAEADDIVTVEEAAMISCITNQRKVSSQFTVEELELDSCIEVIATSEYAHECVDLLETLANIDGEYHYDEKEFIDTVSIAVHDAEELASSCPETEKAKFKIPSVSYQHIFSALKQRIKPRNL